MDLIQRPLHGESWSNCNVFHHVIRKNKYVREEQKRIVARIEEILSRVEKAKKLKTDARKDAEAIMQAALHEVFTKAEEKWSPS